MNSSLALLRAAVDEARRNRDQARIAVGAAADDYSLFAALAEYMRADDALDAAYRAVADANREEPGKP